LTPHDRSCFFIRVTVNPHASTHDRILRKGLALMSQAGLGGVTLGVLADQVGMSKSGLFAHFRSKEDVQIELLSHMAGFAADRILRPSMEAAEGLPRLRALIRGWFGWAQRAGLPGGCPVAAGMFEFDDVEGRVRSKILEMEAEWRRMLLELVRRAVELGHLRGDLNIDQFVWELCAIYLGHHAAHRFLRSADADARAEAALEVLVNRALPPASSSLRAHQKDKSSRKTPQRCKFARKGKR
jgi:AcrR family transcriptional regulator